MLHLDFGRGVLVVDDHFVVRTAVAQTLVAVGYQVVLAENGRQAVEYLRLRTYALVITDQLMVVDSGQSLVRYLGQHHPGLPVLVTTGQTTDPAINEAFRERAIGLLAKPFTPDELRKAIGHVMQAGTDVPGAAV